MSTRAHVVPSSAGRFDQLPSLAAELVRFQPDVIITHGRPRTRALKEATTTIPIVMAVSGDE
jgi:putative ABC transport system substrate-binding protein